MVTATFGFNNISSQESFSRYEHVTKRLNWDHGVLSGFTVTVSGGNFVISDGLGAVPGVLLEQGGTFPAPSGATAGVLVVDVDWKATTPAERVEFAVRAGAQPNLPQAPGDRWQLPLYGWGAGVATLTTARLTRIAPQPRRTIRHRMGTTGGTVTATPGSNPVLHTQPIADPGWPYAVTILADAQCRAAGSTAVGAYGVLRAHVGGTAVDASSSPKMKNTTDLEPLSLATTTAPRSGATEVKLTADVSTGGGSTTFANAVLHVLVHPA